MPASAIGYEVVRNATFYSDRAVRQDPSSLTVIQQDYCHDIVTMVSHKDDNTPNAYRTGTPVSIDWGLLNRRVETFYGYVHHVEPMTISEGKPEQRSLVKIVCAGVTYPMQEPRRQIYKSRTIPSVLQEIFDIYKFSSHISADARVWDTLVQADNQSDWQFVCSLAQRLGWSVHARNTDIVVSGRFVRDSTARNTASVFAAPGPMNPPGGLGVINTFHGIDGETTPDGGQKAIRLMQGIDPWQGTEFSATMGVPEGNLGALNPAPMNTAWVDDTARTYDEAVARLGGVAIANKWYLQASAEVSGDACVWPGKLVCLLGIGAKSSGFWYVQSAEHELSQGNYVLHLSLGRDAYWDHGMRPNLQRRRVIQLRTATEGTVAAEVPETKLVRGYWRAAYSTRVA